MIRMNVAEQVCTEIDRLTPRMVEALSQLVRIESVTPKYPGQSYAALVGRESDATAFVAELYQESGASVDRFAMEPGRDNAVGVIRGSGKGRSLIFNGHIDVVPSGDPDRWTSGSPFSGRVDGDRVWGRGSTDMKGGVVAHAFAGVALHQAGVRLGGDMIMQAVVGEETGDHECGTTAVAKRGYLADAAVVCEPTSSGAGPAPITVAPGLIWFSVTVKGKQAHSGLRGLTVHPTLDGAALGVNAIDKGFYLYQHLRQLEDEWAETKRHPLFPAGYFGLLPGVVNGSPTGVQGPFSLSDTMTIEYSTYHHPDQDNEQTKSEIENRIRRASELDPWLRDHPPVIDWKLEWPPTQISTDEAICTALQDAHRSAANGTRFQDPTGFAGLMGVCDTTWLQAFGVPSLVFGPGDIKLAHSADEYVRIDELVLACKTYALLALQWCGTPPPN